MYSSCFSNGCLRSFRNTKCLRCRFRCKNKHTLQIKVPHPPSVDCWHMRFNQTWCFWPHTPVLLTTVWIENLNELTSNIFRGDIFQITAWLFSLVLQELKGLMCWILCNRAMWLCVGPICRRERDGERELGREIREAVCQSGRERNSRLWVGGLKIHQSPRVIFPIKIYRPGTG